jgi:isoamylase
MDAATMQNKIEHWRGSPFPLGATLHADGVNFALYSEHAEKVVLCLFDAEGRETHQLDLVQQTYKVWHGFIPGLKAGQRYAYRVHGVYDPQNGLRFNPHKILIDPYTKATTGPIKWDPAVFAYQIGNPEEDLVIDTRDSAPFIPKSIVIDDAFDWEGDCPPEIPWHETVIYEAHVKGLTKLHPDVPEKQRGTYSGLGHPKVIEHLTTLGITAIELLPVQQFVEEDHLQEKNLHNYWGYSTIGYFAPDWRLSSGENDGSQVREFKQMVKTMHKAGIEVILDVVYNHTAEGNHLGPTLSFKGIDNSSYYRLKPDEARFYMDYTGCGNTLNVVNPHTLRLMIDSLRYWVTEMHVDGFRFDLASALARGFHEVNQLNSFFAILQQDPVLSEVKLIAEPWDLGEGGYQVGNFPDQWSEWNDKYRDTVRSFWKGDSGVLGDLGYRLMGSSDLYAPSGRGPSASVNFITAHDGFTLNDLVSYNEKHNEANQEDNRDGNDNNHSWNCGAEGPTDNPDVNRLRDQMKRNFLATLLLSQGVPMLMAGDEMGRTQQGNNNAYCQDNEISWVHWDKADKSLMEFTRRAILLRREHAVFHRRNFFEGERLRPGGKKDVQWFLPDGREMGDEAWGQDFAKCLGLELSGNAIHEHDERNRLIKDDNFIWLVNASENRVDFTFPEGAKNLKWELIFDTARAMEPRTALADSHSPYPLEARSTTVFIQRRSGN